MREDLIERLGRGACAIPIRTELDAQTVALLREAAAALEAAREDARRWRERYTAELACSRMELHGDTHNEAIERAERTAERIAAIDQARGKAGGEVEGG